MGEQSVIAMPVWTGAESRKLRNAMRLTQREYAERLGISPRTVAGWEAKGKQAVLSAESHAILDTALERADPDVRQRFAASVTEGPPAPDGHSQALAQPWNSAVLLDGHDAERVPDTFREGELVPVTEADISAVRGMLAALTAADHQFGGGFARRTAGEFLEEAVKPRLAVPGSGEVPSQFRAAAAEFQMRVAWMHLDVADPDGARAAAQEAFKLAQQSKDMALCSWAMAMCALLETWQGNTAAAVAYGHAGVGLSTGGPRRVQAFAHGKLARALAAARDSDGAQAALAAARTLFESARPIEDERVPETIRDDYSDAYLLDEESHCFRDLGMDSKALDLSQQCLDLRGADRFTRNRAFATGNRALTLARLGEVDEACDTAVELLRMTTTLDSSRALQRMDAVIAALAPFRTTRMVAELLDQVHDAGSRRLTVYRSGERPHHS